MNMERGIILVPKFVFKVINNERNILTHYEIADRTVKQVKNIAEHSAWFKLQQKIVTTIYNNIVVILI